MAASLIGSSTALSKLSQSLAPMLGYQLLSDLQRREKLQQAFVALSSNSASALSAMGSSQKGGNAAAAAATAAAAGLGALSSPSYSLLGQSLWQALLLVPAVCVVLQLFLFSRYFTLHGSHLAAIKEKLQLMTAGRSSNRSSSSSAAV